MRSFDYLAMPDGSVEIEMGAREEGLPLDIEDKIEMLLSETDTRSRQDHHPIAGTAFIYQQNSKYEMIIRIDHIKGNIGVIELDSYPSSI